jgi:hypothetical protein
VSSGTNGTLDFLAVDLLVVLAKQKLDLVIR